MTLDEHICNLKLQIAINNKANEDDPKLRREINEEINNELSLFDELKIYRRVIAAYLRSNSDRAEERYMGEMVMIYEMFGGGERDYD